MPQGFLDGHDIGTGLIQVKAKGMAARMEHESTIRKSYAFNGFVEDISNRLSVDMRCFILPGEKPVIWRSVPVRSTDVFNQDQECFP